MGDPSKAPVSGSPENASFVTGEEAEQIIRPVPMFQQDSEGVWRFDWANSDGVVRTFGVRNISFYKAVVADLLNISGQADDLKDEKNSAIAIVAEIAPKDAIEALLATQMAAVHLSSMRHARMMAGSQTIEQLEIHERTFNKLTRTFTAQMEALRKHRHGGQQKMTVEHVTVNDGGQAIVGNVEGGAKK